MVNQGPAETRARQRAWVSEKVEVLPHGGGRALVAVQSIDAGERLIALAHVFVDLPSKYTIQVEEHLHQAGTEEADDFMNHSCAPNVTIDFDRLEVIALQAIAAGELVTFDYNICEWDMREPFTCVCGSARCIGEIRGFRHLDRKQRQRLLPWLSPYLRRRLAESEGDDDERKVS
ncbi:MAG TPA: SET domain-containing protein-lysine N-methyltransferase [Nannocystis exedens]|nr:SET domain-containing protein-lysine N-methyltransferase [Nannocystis exedens]